MADVPQKSITEILNDAVDSNGVKVNIGVTKEDAIILGIAIMVSIILGATLTALLLKLLKVN